MTKVPAPIDDRPPPAASDVARPGSHDNDNDDSDHDHPQQDPEFAIHAVDDWRWPPAPRVPLAHRLVLLPAQQPPPPAAAGNRNAARVQRLRYFMLFPQCVLCGATLLLGGVMSYYAKHPSKWPDLTWVIVCSLVLMLLALLSTVLSCLGVYVYDS